MVMEISHLLCDPGVNSERWPLVTCEAFLKHHKNQQEELPVCSILNGNVEEINMAKKTCQPFGSGYAPVSFQGPQRYLPLSWTDSAAFPVWCSFSCWGNLRS